MNIDGKYYDREKAILIYKGKIYEDELNHQYALQVALEEYNDSLENYIEDEREIGAEENFIQGNIEALQDYTYNKSVKNELFTFSNFGNVFLIAHVKENLFLNFALISEYAEKNNLKLGYHSDFIKDKNNIILI